MKSNLLILISLLTGSTLGYSIDNSLAKRGKEIEIDAETNNIHQHRNRGGKLVKRRKTRNRNGSNDIVSDVGIFKRRRSGTEPEDNFHTEVENNIHQNRNREGRLVKRRKTRNRNGSSDVIADVGLFKRRRSGTQPEDNLETETNHKNRNRGGRRDKQSDKHQDKKTKPESYPTPTSTQTTTSSSLPTLSV